jgi:photosystem II stability/assembly factor-like uncharacterized protein
VHHGGARIVARSAVADPARPGAAPIAASARDGFTRLTPRGWRPTSVAPHTALPLPAPRLNDGSKTPAGSRLRLLPSACVALLALAACAPEGPIAEAEAPAATAPGATAELSTQPLASGVHASLRGLHVVDERVAWASGSDGHVGITTDGGRTWTFRRIAGHEDRDFRDVEGFSAQRAVVMAVASPGLILETTDGGETWSERFRDERPEVFLDAIECVEDAGWPRSARREESATSPGASSAPSPALVAGSGPIDASTCLAFGDPIDGRFLLLRSLDGGRSWSGIEGPEALPGEAAFAASGTALRFGRRPRSTGGTEDSTSGTDGAAATVEVVIGTGGAARARVLSSTDLGRSWRVEEVPLAAGAPSRGVFSLVACDAAGWVAVGGDHLAESETAGTAARRIRRDSTPAGGPEPPGERRGWVAPTIPPAGYRSAVERLADGRLVATGPSGTDVSDDGGATWRPITSEGFHAVRRSPAGDLVLLAGANGRIVRLVATRR